jgi:hypothetical protein
MSTVTQNWILRRNSGVIFTVVKIKMVERIYTVKSRDWWCCSGHWRTKDVGAQSMRRAAARIFDDMRRENLSQSLIWWERKSCIKWTLDKFHTYFLLFFTGKKVTIMFPFFVLLYNKTTTFWYNFVYMKWYKILFLA